MKRWYYQSGDGEIGPLTIDDVQAAAADGRIVSTTMVRAEASGGLREVGPQPADSIEVTHEAVQASNRGMTVAQWRRRRTIFKILLFMLITVPVAFVREWVGTSIRDPIKPARPLPQDELAIADESGVKFEISGEAFHAAAPEGFVPISYNSVAWPRLSQAIPDGAQLMAAFLTPSDAARKSVDEVLLSKYVTITSLSGLNRSRSGLSASRDAFAAMRQQFLGVCPGTRWLAG